MRERVIKLRADQVRPGQVVVDLAHGRIHKRAGRWPAVTAANYQDRGEDGRPMVYIELSDQPGAVFPLHPDETVTVAAEQRRTIRADQLRVGQVVLDLTHGTVRQQDGVWPRVTGIDHRNGRTVCLVLSAPPGAVQLDRSTAVTVLAEGW